MSVFSVADSTFGDDTFLTGNESESTKTHQKGKGDVEMTEIENVEDDGLEGIGQHKHLPGIECSNGSSIHGINRPYFHVDVDTAVKSALAFEELNDH